MKLELSSFSSLNWNDIKQESKSAATHTWVSGWGAGEGTLSFTRDGFGEVRLDGGGHTVLHTCLQVADHSLLRVGHVQRELKHTNRQSSYWRSRQAEANVIMWQEEDAENGPHFSQPWDPPSKVGHGSAAVWMIHCEKSWCSASRPQNQSVLQHVSLNTCTWTQLMKSWTRWRLNVLVCGLFKNTCRGEEPQHVKKGEPDPAQKKETDNTGKPAGQDAFKPSTKPSQISDSLQVYAM